MTAVFCTATARSAANSDYHRQTGLAGLGRRVPNLTRLGETESGLPFHVATHLEESL